jgi:hypothetical protein
MYSLISDNLRAIAERRRTTADAISAALDAAQAEDVRAEAREDAADRWRYEQKLRTRRSARALAQILLGRRFRAIGIQYEPEFDNLPVERSDGTRPEHYACSYQGYCWALGAGEALVIWTPGDNPRFYAVSDIVELGRAVKRMRVLP